MAECSFTDVSCKAGQVMSNATDDLKTDVLEGFEWAVELTFTGWMNFPVPVISEEMGAVAFILAHTQVLGAMFAAIGLVCYGIGMVFQRRGIIASLGRYIILIMVVFGGAVTLSRTFLSVADGYADWILDSSTQGTGMAQTLIDLMNVTGGVAWIITVLFGGAGIVMSVLLGIFMLVRSIALLILIGASPIIAAATFTEMGKAWANKALTFFIAFLLFKPVAATIYATAFFLIGEGNIFQAMGLGDAIVKGMNLTVGMAAMFMSVVALPLSTRKRPSRPPPPCPPRTPPQATPSPLVR